MDLHALSNAVTHVPPATQQIQKSVYHAIQALNLTPQHQHVKPTSAATVPKLALHVPLDMSCLKNNASSANIPTPTVLPVLRIQKAHVPSVPQVTI